MHTTWPRALAIAIALASVSTPLYAQTSSSQQEVFSFDLPAASLADTINAIAREGGVVISLDPAVMQGKQSSGVQGRMTARQALERALEDSGLELWETGSGNFGVRMAPAGKNDAAVLRAVNVRDTELSATTERSGSYKATGPAATATGLALTTRETPQSISVVTTQQALDRNDHTLQEALRYAPGINAIQAYGDSRWSYYSRGFSIGNVQYEGVSTSTHTFTRDANPQEDMAIFDRIEVVRGATGLMTGAGDPSGSINLVRKRASAGPRTEIEVTAGSIGKGGLTVDSSQPLNQSGTVRGRIVATGAVGAASERDDNDRKYGLIYGTLDIDLSEKTLVSLAASYGKEDLDGHSWGGWPLHIAGSFFSEYDASASPALPWEYNDRNQAAIYLDIEHRFDNEWNLKVTARDSHGEMDQLSSAFYWDSGQLWRYGWDIGRENHSYSGSLSVAGPVTLFGRKHELTLGASGNADVFESNTRGGYTWAIPDPLNLDEPDAKDIAPLGYEDWAEERTKQYGVYAAGRFELAESLHLIVGNRFAWYELTQKLSATPSTGYDAEAETIPYIGLVYDATNDLTLYASYTSVFKPQSEVNSVGAQLDPAEGTNIELGLKASLSDDNRLEANFAIYQSEQTGLPERVTDVSCIRTDILYCYRAAEEIRTRGVDIEFVGAITGQWNLSASYTYADSEYVAGPNDGKRYNSASMPRSMAKLYTAYDFVSVLEGLTLGGGVRVQSGLTSEEEGYYRIHQPGYAVVDIMARYDLTASTQIQLNIDNIFDRTYYNAIDYYGSFISPGTTASLTLRTSF